MSNSTQDWQFLHFLALTFAVKNLATSNHYSAMGAINMRPSFAERERQGAPKNGVQNRGIWTLLFDNLTYRWISLSTLILYSLFKERSFYSSLTSGLTANSERPRGNPPTKKRVKIGGLAKQSAPPSDVWHRWRRISRHAQLLAPLFLCPSEKSTCKPFHEAFNASKKVHLTLDIH